LYQQTKLSPEILVFENKQLLKKKMGVVMFLNPRVLSIAAVLLALALLGILYNSDSQRNKESYATIEKPAKPINQEVSNGLASESGDFTKDVPKNEKTNERYGENLRIGSNQAVGERANEHADKRFETQKPIISPFKEIENRQIALQLPPVGFRVEAIKKVDHLLAFNESASELSIENINDNNGGEGFITPADWIKIKMKERMPETMTKVDSINKGGAKFAGNMALQLVEKTTGISYQTRKDSIHGNGGFAIVSKYFAYERIIK
jgi:hypothetical protein